MLHHGAPGLVHRAAGDPGATFSPNGLPLFELFYGNDDGWTDQAKFYRQIYDESRVGGKTSLQNFRRTYEGRNPVG